MKKFILFSTVSISSAYALSSPSIYEQKYGTNLHHFMHWSNLTNCIDKMSQYVWIKRKTDSKRILVIGHVCKWCNHVDVLSECDISDDSTVTPFLAESKYNGKYWTNDIFVTNSKN